MGHSVPARQLAGPLSFRRTSRRYSPRVLRSSTNRTPPLAGTLPRVGAHCVATPLRPPVFNLSDPTSRQPNGSLAHSSPGAIARQCASSLALSRVDVHRLSRCTLSALCYHRIQWHPAIHVRWHPATRIQRHPAICARRPNGTQPRASNGTQPYPPSIQPYAVCSGVH